MEKSLSNISIFTFVQVTLAQRLHGGREILLFTPVCMCITDGIFEQDEER